MRFGILSARFCLLLPLSILAVGMETPAVNLAGQVTVTSTGFVYSRASGTFNGTLVVKNTSSQSTGEPIQIVLTNLRTGVTLANATGFTGGNPFITVPGGGTIAPGQSATVNVQFKNPSNVSIAFTAIAYSGGL